MTAALQAALRQAWQHHQHGRLHEAQALYEEVLARDPRQPDALHLLGLLALQQGQPDVAAGLMQQALALQPALAAAHSNLGHAYAQLGHPGAAIDCQLEALRLADVEPFRQAFVQSVRAAHFGGPHPQARAALLRALREGWADVDELLTPAVSLVECSEAVSRALAAGDDEAALDDTLLAAIAADELLLALLERETLNSLALERLLTRVRRRMLADALAERSAAPDWRALQAGIARQCFLNEYVYAFGDRERQLLAALRARLEAQMAEGTRPSPQALLACAACMPLSSLAGAKAWADQTWPQPLDALLTQQLREPAQEQALRATLPRLTPIDDAVSQGVRAQYEQHPYPRWVSAPRVPAAVALEQLLRQRFPGAPFEPLAKAGPLDVLVAGCGTGQHPIRVAREFAGAQVLAVDLSLASLAYAKRKTAELALTGIDYAQADILRLGTLDRRFDLIESSGVLHHMADPLAGWQVLVDLLRPGGVMAIGLYSELGRRDVVAARERLATAGLPGTDDEIRQCRQRLIDEGLVPPSAPFLVSRDFYATSGCRDLLFHVQEHRFTLPQLKAALRKLGLIFIGFALEPEVMGDYARRFPEDRARADLDGWHRFETERPDTFARMYAFWVQKPRG